MIHLCALFLVVSSPAFAACDTQHHDRLDFHVPAMEVAEELTRRLDGQGCDDWQLVAQLDQMDIVPVESWPAPHATDARRIRVCNRAESPYHFQWRGDWSFPLPACAIHLTLYLNGTEVIHIAPTPKETLRP